MSTSAGTPECDRFLAAREKTEPVGEFLEWLSRKSFVIAKRRGFKRDGVRDLVPVSYSIESLLAEWQGIDLAEVEQERRAILADLQSQARAESDEVDE